MFDRVLTRYWWGWMVNREEFMRAFWMEFKEEEYERDVCRRDWKTMTLKGHNGFYLTPSEQQNGITAEQFTAGLTPIYSSPTPSPSPTTLSRSLPSPQPQAQPRASTITSYKWDNTTYALANELVVTGTHISSDPVHVALRRAEKEWEEDGWEGEEGRKRKRMKEMGVVMRELGLGGEVDNAIVGEVGGDMNSVVVGDVQVPQTPVPLRGLPTPPPTGPQRSPLSTSVLTPDSSFIVSPLSPSPPPSPIATVNTQKMTAHSSNAKESTSGGSVHGDEERDVQKLEKVVGVTPAPSFIQNSEVPGSSPMDTTVVEKVSEMTAAQSPAVVQLDEPNRVSPIGSSADVEPRTASIIIVESRPSSAQDGLESGTDKDPIPIASSSPPSQVEQSPDQSMDIDATPVHRAPPPPFVTWPVAIDDVYKNTVRTEARASLPVVPNIPDEASASTEPAGTRKVIQLNGSVREDVSGTTDPTPPSFIASTSKYASSPNPEVITQVLNVVPSMLSQLHSLLDVASSKSALPSSSNDNESAIEKIRYTTASLFATQSTSSDTLVSTLIERMNALESEVKSNQEELKRSQEENERTTLRVVELEARLKACESHLSEHMIAPNHVDNGISSVGYSTPLSRTSSIDGSIPLPIKSQRKQMNLIAMSPSRPPSTDGDGLV
ncbi:hypothetical protein BDQ17DRAFT_338192 [Cyathus striatus]|nr:hypothetical protein BDQ17DRAFT_338192 [Cyathus striatus]